MKNLTIITARKLAVKSLNKLAAKADTLDSKSLNIVHTVIVENKQKELPNAEVIKILSTNLSKLQKSYKGKKVLLYNNGTEAHLLVEDEQDAIAVLEGKDIVEANKLQEEKSSKKIAKAKKEIKEIVKKPLIGKSQKPLQNRTIPQLKKILGEMSYEGKTPRKKADLIQLIESIGKETATKKQTKKEIQAGKVVAKIEKGSKFKQQLVSFIPHNFDSKSTKSQLIAWLKENASKTKFSEEILGKEYDYFYSKKELYELAKKVIIELEESKQPEIQVTAEEGKKYKKSGKRSTEWEFNGIKVSRGGNVNFTLKGKIEIGEFRHVNQNIHSPKGYAVIKFNGKSYERTIEKVTTAINNKLQMNAEVKALFANSGIPMTTVESMLEMEEITQEELNDCDYMEDRLDVWKENS